MRKLFVTVVACMTLAATPVPSLAQSLAAANEASVTASQAVSNAVAPSGDTGEREVLALDGVSPDEGETGARSGVDAELSDTPTTDVGEWLKEGEADESASPAAFDSEQPVEPENPASTGESTDDAAAAGEEPPSASAGVAYNAHVQNIGWQSATDDDAQWFSNGQQAGTTGQSLRLEAVQVVLDTGLSGSVEYQVHVQNVGWQDWRADGDIAGSQGFGYRLEAIRVRLVGDIAQTYEVYYRAHTQGYGWLGWASGGAISGTTGLSTRIEALEILLVALGVDPAPTSTVAAAIVAEALAGNAHVQNVGWMGARGATSNIVLTLGTTGQSRQLEALSLALSPNVDGVAGIVGNAHVHNIGWLHDIEDESTWVASGGTIGTTGRSLAIEALQLDLPDETRAYYDLYYRVHVADLGWLGWTSNGLAAGSVGLGKQVEAVELLLVAKGMATPALLDRAFVDGDGLKTLTATIATAGDTTATVRSTFVGTLPYLFLPSFADTSALSLSAGDTGMGTVYVADALTGEAVEVASTPLNIDVMGLETAANGARLLYATLGVAYPLAPIYVMQSANIGGLFLVSDDPQNKGRAFVEGSPNHSAKATGAMLLVNPDGTTVYDDTLKQIKGRGNTTWTGTPKKSYQIKLDTKCDLLETPGKAESKANKAKTWVLLANSFDPTMLNNTIAYQMALELGLVGTESAFVDLYYDGEYRGTYQLCEKIEINSGRVDIFDLEEAIEDANAGVDLETLSLARATNRYGQTYQYVVGAADPDDYSGGFLLEVDGAYYASEACWFKTTNGTFVVKSPEFASQNVMRYMSEFVQEAMNNYARGVVDGAAGATFDLTSLVKVNLVQQLTKSNDFGYSSTFFYKRQGDDRLYSGPVWDFDRSLANYYPLVANVDIYSYKDFHFTNGFTRWMFESAAFRREFARQWVDLAELVRTELLARDAEGATYLRSIYADYDTVSASAAMDRVRWNASKDVVECVLLGSYEAQVAFLRDWLTNRVAWVNENLARLLNGTYTKRSTVYDGIDYSPVFDHSYYRSRYPDLQAAFGNDDAALLRHFVEYGMAEGRVASRNFDVSFYRGAYADLRQAYGSDLRAYYLHFITYGAREGRSAAKPYVL